MGLFQQPAITTPQPPREARITERQQAYLRRTAMRYGFTATTLLRMMRFYGYFDLDDVPQSAYTSLLEEAQRPHAWNQPDKLVHDGRVEERPWHMHIQDRDAFFLARSLVYFTHAEVMDMVGAIFTDYEHADLYVMEIRYRLESYSRIAKILDYHEPRDLTRPHLQPRLLRIGSD